MVVRNNLKLSEIMLQDTNFYHVHSALSYSRLRSKKLNLSFLPLLESNCYIFVSLVKIVGTTTQPTHTLIQTKLTGLEYDAKNISFGS